MLQHHLYLLVSIYVHICAYLLLRYICKTNILIHPAYDLQPWHFGLTEQYGYQHNFCSRKAMITLERDYKPTATQLQTTFLLRGLATFETVFTFCPKIALTNRDSKAFRSISAKVLLIF